MAGRMVPAWTSGRHYPTQASTDKLKRTEGLRMMPSLLGRRRPGPAPRQELIVSFPDCNWQASARFGQQGPLSPDPRGCRGLSGPAPTLSP